MSIESNGTDFGLCTAAADLSAKQFLAVGITGDFAVNAITNIATPMLGILQNKPISGAAALVRTEGVTKAIAGGTITAGAKLTVNASSQLVATTASTAVIVGYALQAAVAGDIFAAYIGGPGTGHVMP